MGVTQNIPQDQWQLFFTDIGRRYQGWGVTVEVMRLDLGDQTATEALPLQGITYEEKGSQAGDIYIEAGDTPEELVIHHVDQPRAVRAAESGDEEDLEIESADGTKTLVRLRRLVPLDAEGHA